MAKQLNVDLRFTADTSKAKQSIQELQTAIQKLGYGTMPKNGLVNPAEFEKASSAARELAYHLNNAYNAKTGNLDLSRLNSSLKAANTDLPKLTSSFKNAGTTGQQAFVSLAKAIASADQPALTLNSHLSTMWTTLKNVARFQISSSIMHGLVGGLQSAYGYAQDLNESLNNIRIVTGQSVDQMARFAEEANKTARSLSASTLDYTNASLIYYQQGLDDAAVKERTDVTIKMANVARESAETVSEQMTAIWNNFDDGSKSLEYYADVITALGAATASSSSEISQGLEKFAAVADTVGLSYENATAALATITATTRQSADTVGTGLRTLFSRLQGLSLGDTLEDGVDLNKYSKALEKVGVQALDSSGNLRRMDDVLEDLGARWGQLSNAQQTALAQIVGGVRQYTTLIALMDNWDFMKQNQEVAANAEGTLQGQADIYAESWEAAQKRVQAAAQAIYSDLINDKFFIKITNLFETVLTGLDTFIDHFGGLKSLLIAALSFVLSMTANKIGPALQKMVQNIQVLTGGAKNVYSELQDKFQKNVQNEIDTGNYNNAQAAELTGTSNLLLMRTKLNAVTEELSETEKMQAELAIQGLQLQTEAYKKLGEEVDQLIQAEQQASKEAEETGRRQDQATLKLTEANQKAKAAQSGDGSGGLLIQSASAIKKSIGFESIVEESKKAGNAIADNLRKGLLSGTKETQHFGDAFNDVLLQIKSASDLKEAKAQLNDFRNLTTELFKDISSKDKQEIGALFKQAEQTEDIQVFQNILDQLMEKLSTAGIKSENLGKVLINTFGMSETAVNNLIQARKEYDEAVKANEAAEGKDEEIKAKLEAATKKYTAAQEQANESAKNFKPQHTVDGVQTITSLAAGLGQVVTLFNALKSVVETLNNEDATFGEKAIAILSALSIALPTAIGLTKTFKTVKDGIFAGAAKRMAASTGEAAATTSEGVAAGAATAPTMSFGAALWTVLAPILPLIAALSALGVAIFAIIKAQKAMEAQKPEKVYERTQQAVQNTTNALNECKQKVEDIRNAFDKYNEITKRLSEVKTDTEEWNAALKESNEEILALLEKYPELKEFLHRDATTNRLTIDQDAVNEQLEKEQNNKLRDSYNARIINNNAEVAVAKSELPDIENYGWSSSAIRDVFLEAVEKGYISGLEEDNQLIKEMLRQKGISNTNQTYEDSNGNQIEGGEITDVYDRLIDALLENKKAYSDYTKLLQANTEQNELWAEEIGKTFADTIGASAWMQNNGLNKELGQKYLDEYNAEAEKRTDKKALSEEYLDLLGIDATKTKWDGANFQYKTEDSDEWEKIPWEEVLSNVVNAVVSEDFNASEYAQAFAQDLYERSGFNSLTETANLNDSQKQIFENLLGTIDWSSPTEGLEQLKEKLNLLGISVPEKALQAFIDKLLDINDAANDIGLDKSDTAYREMTEAESDYKQKQETYNTLKEQGYSTEDAGKELEEAAEKYLNSIDKYDDAVKKERAARKELLDLDEDQLTAISTYITKNADKVEDLDDDLKDNADAVEDVAIAWLRFERAAEAAAKSSEDWKEALSSDSIREQTIAMGEMANTYGDLLNMDGSVLSEDFLKNTENLDLMLEAIQGNGEAYDELVRRASEDQIKANIDWTNLEEGTNKFNEIIALRDSAMEALSSMEVGPIDDTKFIASLEQMINNLGLSVEEATNLLGSMGVDAQIENTTEQTEDSSQTNDIVPEIDREGSWTVPVVAGNGSIVRRPVPLEGVKFRAVPNAPTKTVSSKTATALKITSATKTSGGNIKYNNTKHFTPSSSKGSGGKGSSGSGGSKSKPSTPKTAEDRYHDALNRREKTKNAFDKAQNEKEELWGQARIKKWKEAQKALEAYIKAQQDLLKDTERWLKTDKKALQDALSKINITITPQFDENGTITNYEAILGQINNLYQKYNGNEDMTALIEAAQKALEQYDKTSDLWIDRKKELDDLNKQLDKLRKEEQIEQKDRERYHRIERQLAENDRKLDEMRTKTERAHGLEKIKWLEEEQKLLIERNQLQQEYIKEIEETRKYLNEDKNKLVGSLTELGIDIKFDENGDISNIENIFDQLTAAWNNGNNTIFGTDPKEAEKKYDAVMDALSQYEETLDLLHDKEKEIVDTENEIIDKALEIITTKVELKISISDRDLKRIDYALKHIEDDVYKTAEALALMGKQGDESMAKIAAYEQGITEIFQEAFGKLEFSINDLINMSDEELQAALSGMTEESRAQVEAYCDALREEKLQLMELQDTIREKVMAAYDELNAKVDEAYEKFDKFTGLLEHYKTIVELSAGTLGIFTKSLQDSIQANLISNAENQTEAARKRLEQAKKDLEQYTGDDPEMLKKLQDNVAAANEAFLSSIENTLQLLKDSYDTTFNEIFDNLNKWIDNAEKAYGRQKELNEEYLTDYEKTYQLNKLSRDLDKTLNNTNSAKGRARLLELQKEINDGMADANRLSAYDVEFLQKKLALEQARLDLENARNAKSYMQLQRGADGQWGYVYTADEAAVEQAEQAYEDKQHDIYELQKRQEENLTTQLHSLASSWSQAKRELDERRASGELTEEQYQAEYAKQEAFYKERARYMFEQMGNLFDNNNWADQMYNMGLAMGIDESTLKNILESDNLEDAMNLFLDHFSDAQTASDEAYATYQNRVSAFFADNGVTAKTLQDAIEQIGTGSKENIDEVTKASLELSNEFRKDVIAANTELAKLDASIKSVTDKLDPLTERLYNLMNVLDGGTPMDLSGVDLTKDKTIIDKTPPIGILPTPINPPVSNTSSNNVGTPSSANESYFLYQSALAALNNNYFTQIGSDFLRLLMPQIPRIISDTLDQTVQITASFPSVVDHNEIEEAFNNLINKATQYANRKTMWSQTFGDNYNY